MRVLATAFAVFNVLLLFGYIYFQSSLIQLSYQRQRLEKELERSKQERAILLQELNSMQSLDGVAIYAKESLGMQPVKISRVCVDSGCDS